MAKSPFKNNKTPKSENIVPELPKTVNPGLMTVKKRTQIDNIEQKAWQWTEERYEAAHLLADGHSKTFVAQALGVEPRAIQSLCSHEEFVKYINKTIMETGLAMKEDRLARMKRMADTMENIFYRKAEQVVANPRDEQITFLSAEFRNLLKQIAVEKEEYIETTRMAVEGGLKITTDFHKVDEYVKSLADEERTKLLNDFKNIADEIVTTQNIKKQMEEEGR